MPRFDLAANDSHLRRECVGGIATFAAMAYIAAVNPSILSVRGMDKGLVTSS